MSIGEQNNYIEGPTINDPVQDFFTRPGEEVIGELVPVWTIAGEKDVIYSGTSEGSVFVVQADDESPRYFQVEEAILYSDEETMRRWKDSRGPAITKMTSGTLFAYSYRTSVLTFLKTQGAENIQLKELVEVDEYGKPIEKGAVVTTGKTGELFGLEHKGQASLTMLEGEVPTFVIKKVQKSSSQITA